MALACFFGVRQGGGEGGEAASDRLGGGRQEASKLRVPHVAAGRLAQPGGLRGDRLVVRPERGEQRLRCECRLWRPCLGVGPRAGPGAVAVAVQVDRVGDPEDARSPIPRGRLIRSRDGPVRAVTPGPEATATRETSWGGRGSVQATLAFEAAGDGSIRASRTLTPLANNSTRSAVAQEGP